MACGRVGALGVLVAGAALLASGCGCGLHLFRRVPADRYRALALGPAKERDAAALSILRRRGREARSVVRKAIAAAAAGPTCREIRPLAETVLDPCMDEPTRIASALALGRVAREFPCRFPARSAGRPCPPEDDPLPPWARSALRGCAARQAPSDLPWWFEPRSCRRGGGEETPVAVARACVEALGFVRGTEPAFLTALRDDPSQDTQLRIFAGRALSRLTGVLSVSPESLDRLVLEAEPAEAPPL